MKGRLTYDKANTAVDDFNKAMTGKYTLLTTKRAAQTDYIRKKIVAYKELENKNTKGLYRIQLLCNVKHNTYNILTKDIKK